MSDELQVPEAETAEAAPNGGNGNNGHGTNRRKFLVGAAVGAATVAAGAGVVLLAQGEEGPPIGTSVLAKRVRKVPADDPEASEWDQAPTTRVQLDGQVTALPMRPTPSHPWVDVQALHDAKTIAFRVSWPDSERDDLTIECDSFRDACAVLLAPDPMNEALRIMGTADIPVTLMHWKADWQRDVDHGYQDPRVAYPNASVDYYPPLAAANGGHVTLADYQKANATEWLPGLHVGNPMSQAKRTTPVEKLSARGFGTATTLPTQDAVGSGVWKDGGWTVVLAKSRTGTDDVEFPLRTGRDYGLAVAVWSGSEQDRGSRKSPSKALLQLVMEP